MIVKRKKRLERIEGGLKGSAFKSIDAPGFHSSSSSTSSFQKFFTSLDEQFLGHRDLDGTPRLFKKMMKDKNLLRQIMEVAKYKDVPIPYSEGTLMIKDKYIPLWRDGVAGGCIACYEWDDPNTYYTAEGKKITEEHVKRLLLNYFNENNDTERVINEKISKL